MRKIDSKIGKILKFIFKNKNDSGIDDNEFKHKYK